MVASFFEAAFMDVCAASYITHYISFSTWQRQDLLLMEKSDALSLVV